MVFPHMFNNQMTMLAACAACCLLLFGLELYFVTLANRSKRKAQEYLTLLKQAHSEIYGLNRQIARHAQIEMQVAMLADAGPILDAIGCSAVL